MGIKELLQKGFWTLLARTQGAGFMFLMLLLFARWLGPEGFGVFSLGFTTMTILGVLSRWGTDQVLLKQVGAHWESEAYIAKGYAISALQVVFVISSIVALLIFLFHETLAREVFNKPEYSEVLLYFGLLTVPISINYSLSEIYKGMGKPILAAYLQNVIAPFIAVVLGVFILIFYDFNVDSSVKAYGFGILISLILSLIFWNAIIPKIKGQKVKFREVIREGWPMLLVTSGGLIMAWSDMVILGVWGTTLDLGIYSAASRTVLITALILLVVNSITAPRYSKLYKNGDKATLAKLAQDSSLILLMLVIFPTALLLFFPEWVMSWFGEEYIVGASILVILTVGQFINVACGSVGFLLTMTGHESEMRNIILISAVVNILISIVLVNIYGAIGVALATSFSMVLWNVWAMLVVKIKLGFWTFPFAKIKKLVN